jgi:hypothetical protein
MDMHKPKCTDGQNFVDTYKYVFLVCWLLLFFFVAHYVELIIAAAV